MTALLGDVGLLAAMFGALTLVAAGVPLSGGMVPVGWYRTGARMMLAGSILSMAALQLGLLSNDFSIAYIANNSATTTPTIFKMASAWAALEGSIVLWGLVLAVFTYLVYRQLGDASDLLGAGALTVLGIVSVFFFGLMVTVANPFAVCTEAFGTSCAASSPWPWAATASVTEGRGPNPLLQNHFLMAVHPPILYIGYVGLTAPFAFAISALAQRLPGIEWAKRTKQWTLISWSALTTGILLGGWWSYEVLGWGGYWAWDPVENASFMPWLLATAFIHSSFVQIRRGMLQSWNFVLVIATFSLTILGTFLTRSGSITSVHSFTQSAIGPALLAFLAIVVIGSFALFATRAQLVASSPRLESFSSREGAFLTNNLLLTVFGFVVLIGTLFPIFVDAFAGRTVAISAPFFNRFAVPLSLTLILAMGIGPIMPYRVAKLSLVWDRIRTPIQVGLAAGALAVVVGVRAPWPLLTFTLTGFVAAAILRHLYSQAVRLRAKRELTLGTAALRVIQGDPGFWGGQLSHLGVLIIAVGIAGSSGLATADTATIAVGDSISFSGYTVEYRAPFSRSEPNREVLGARLFVSQNGQTIDAVEPRLNRFTGVNQFIPTPGVMSRLSGDLYVSAVDIQADSVTVDLWWFPLQWMVWLGGLVIAIGGVWSATMRRVSRPTGGQPAEPVRTDA